MKSTIRLGMAAAAAALMMIAAAVMPTTAAAQPTCCVRIQNNTACRLTICVHIPGGARRCVTIAPGGSGQASFECPSGTRFFVESACGNDFVLTPGGCVVTQTAGECRCARVCMEQDAECFTIVANPVDGICLC